MHALDQHAAHELNHPLLNKVQKLTFFKEDSCTTRSIGMETGVLSVYVWLVMLFLFLCQANARNVSIVRVALLIVLFEICYQDE